MAEVAIFLILIITSYDNQGISKLDVTDSTGCF
jgi:hypothetical protein